MRSGLCLMRLFTLPPAPERARTIPSMSPPDHSSRINPFLHCSVRNSFVVQYLKRCGSLQTKHPSESSLQTRSYLIACVYQSCAAFQHKAMRAAATDVSVSRVISAPPIYLNDGRTCTYTKRTHCCLAGRPLLNRMRRDTVSWNECA